MSKKKTYGRNKYQEIILETLTTNEQGTFVKNCELDVFSLIKKATSLIIDKVLAPLIMAKASTDNINKVTNEILKSIDLGLEDIFYAVQHNQEYHSVFDKVDSISFNNCFFPRNQLEEFILAFSKEPDSKRIYIKINSSPLDCYILTIKSGVDIRAFGRDKSIHDIRKDTLVKVFYDQITKIDMESLSSLDSTEITQFVNNACIEAKSTDGLIMQHTHALRILTKSRLQEINPQYSTIIDALKHLYATQTVTSEVYHLPQEQKIHFYMTKITGHNSRSWIEYVHGESYKSNCGNSKVSKAIKKAELGITGFKPSIYYHDQDLTETWVAFVSDKVWRDQRIIDVNAIEMFVTMMTSEHARFTSHMGIARAPSYQGEVHKNLAAKLHSFIAKATQHAYPDIKEYMITSPLGHMREIMFKAFHDKGQSTKIYIGDNLTERSKDSLEKLISDLQAMEEAGIHRYDNHIQKYYLKQLDVSLAQQDIAYKDTAYNIIPISAEKAAECIKYLNCTIKGQNNEILHKFTTKDMAGEFAWFFESPHLFKNKMNVPLVTCDLKALATLEVFSTDIIEHVTNVIVIGEVEILAQY